MIEQELKDKLAPVVRTNQIVIWAMAGSLILGTAVLVLLAPDRGGQGPDTPLVSLVAAGVAGMALIARPFLGLIGTVSDDSDLGEPRSNLPATGDSLADRVAANWTTANIVRGAMLEGPGFLAGVAYYVEGVPWVLIIPLVMAGWLLIRMPTMDQLEQRIEERRAGVTPEPDI